MSQGDQRKRAAEFIDLSSKACEDLLPHLKKFEGDMLKAWQKFVPGNSSYPSKATVENLLEYLERVVK